MHVYGQIISKVLIDLNMKIIINLELSPSKLYGSCNEELLEKRNHRSQRNIHLKKQFD